MVSGPSDLPIGIGTATPGPVESGFGNGGSGGGETVPPGGGSEGGFVDGVPEAPMVGTWPSRNNPRSLARPTAKSRSTRRPSSGIRRSRNPSKTLPIDNTPLRTVVLIAAAGFDSDASNRSRPTEMPVPLANRMSNALLVSGSG